MDLERLKERLPQLAEQLDVRWKAFCDETGVPDLADFTAMLRDDGLIDDVALRDLITEMEVVITLSEASIKTAPATRYRTLSLLGKGAMGEVHVARDRLLRRNVAVKRMDPRIAENEVLASRFHTEAQITAQLDHPGVVPVYTLEEGRDGSPEYTMKLIRGHDLSEVIKALRSGYDRKESPDDDHDLPARLEWFLQVCASLAYAHQRGVVHRDLKPANIMIGPFHEVVVMDWGIAKLVGGKDVETTIEGLGERAHETQVGHAIGTPPYMSPEQARAENADLDARSDQYALGLILFELVSLRRALVGNNQVHLLMNAQRGKKAPFQHYGGDPIPPELVAIVDKATAAERDRRYATVEDLADDVRRFLRDEPVLARPDTVLQAIKRWVGRHRGFTLGLVAALTGLVVLVFTVTVAGGIIALEASRYAAAVREEELGEVLAAVSTQASRLDQELARQQGMTLALGFAAEEALRHDPPDVALYIEDGFSKPGQGPPDLTESSVYGAPASLGHVDLALAPDVDPASIEPVLQRLAGLQPALRRTLLLSYGPEALLWDAAEVERAVLQAGAPVVWTYVALEEGALAGYPGVGDYPDDYDPRERPWYTTGENAHSPTWSALDADEGGMGLLLTCTVAVHGPDGQVRGVAAVDWTFAHIIDTLLDPQDLGAPVDVSLVDEQGRVVITSSLKEIARTATEYAPEPFEHPTVFEAMQVRPHGHLEVTTEKGERLFSWQTLHGMPWIYVVEGDAAALLTAD